MSLLSVQTTQDKAGFLPPASRDYVMLFAIFLKSGFASIEFQKEWSSLRLYLGIDIVSRLPLQWVARIETLIGQQQYTGHTATR